MTLVQKGSAGLNTSVAVVFTAIFFGGLFLIILWRKNNKIKELEMKIEALKKEIMKIEKINNNNSVHKKGYKYSPDSSALREWMRWE